MSHFFEEINNLETEDEEIKSSASGKGKTNQEKKEENKDQSKDNKIEELEEEVMELEDSMNTKNVDNFLKSLPKKYKVILKAGMPDFLYHFFADSCLVSKNLNSSVKGKIKKFIEKYPCERKKEKEEIYEEPKNEVNDEEEKRIIEEKFKKMQLIEEEKNEKLNNMLIKIVSKNEKNKKESVTSLLDLYDGNIETLKIYLVLLNLEAQEKTKRSYENAHEILLKIIKILHECEDKSLIFCNVDLRMSFHKSLETILNFLINVVDEKVYSKFDDLLKKLQFIDEGLVEKIRLYFNYFLCKNNEETNDPQYKLIYILRKYNYDDAKDYFLNNRNIFGEESDKYTVEIFNELGLAAFIAKDYFFAFDILQECYFSEEKICESPQNIKKYKRIERILLILTIILEENVVDEPFYDEFIKKARILEDNPFMLENICNTNAEIFRAYFLLVHLCYEKCFDILNEIEPLDSEVYNLLKNKTEVRYQKLIET